MQHTTVCVALLGLASLVSVEAQPTPKALTEVSCKTCRIDLRRERTIGGGSDNFLEDWPSSVAMGSRGEIALAIKGGRGLPRLTTADGDLRPLGRRGSGPGEFRVPVTVAFGQGDTLNVFDLGNGRRSEVVADGRTVRSSQFVGGSAILRLLPSNDILVAYPSATRFHLFDRDGNAVRSFGPSIANRSGTQGPTYLISNVIDGRFWSVVGKSYALEEWSVDGQLLSRMQREAPWLSPDQPISDGALGAEPTAFVSDLRIDSAGRLWILVNVPSETWRSGLGTVDRSRGFISYPQRDFSRLFDTIIEVIDLRSRNVVLSTRADGYFRRFLSDTHLASFREDESGSPLVDVWKILLDQSSLRQN